MIEMMDTLTKFVKIKMHPNEIVPKGGPLSVDQKTSDSKVNQILGHCYIAI
jgi:hypothetical protein